MSSKLLFDREASTEPQTGLATELFIFFGVPNQTFYCGHNPYRSGDDSAKPQLATVYELRFKASSGANNKAEWYGLWTHDDGTQWRPIGFVGDYTTKEVTCTMLGEIVYLDDNAASPTQIARISRTGAIQSQAGADKGFYAEGLNRQVLLAQKTGPTNVLIAETGNGTELYMGSTGWSKVEARGPWHFTGTMFPDGGVQLPNDVPIQSAGGDTLIQFSSGQTVVGDPDRGMTIQSNVTYVLVDNTYVMNIEGAGVGIGTGLSSAHASSVLDVTSTTKGALFPRMTTTQRNAIPSPATGLTIYNTTTKTEEWYDGTAWRGQLADIVALTDNVAGALSRTLAAIPDPTDTPLLADNLRDDLVANVLPKIRDAISSLADAVNDLRTELRTHNRMA